ncbi:hypothetical protein BC628DRAFT_1318523, partial [Trametes gibbosa]
MDRAYLVLAHLRYICHNALTSPRRHIRSRITVCKRLKLKCDRRTPCSSCLKRDTVQRCVYSQAAAEKVDVQTLHNRIIEIERVLAQL